MKMADEQAENQGATLEASDSDSLLDSIADATGIGAGSEGYEKAKRGIGELVRILVQEERTEERVQGGLIDTLIGEIDRKIGAQLDAVLHHEDFQKLESAWRGLEYLVKHTDFRENCRVEMLNVSRQDLADDFADAPDITMSGLYKTVYSAEYGVFGGEAYGAVVGNYAFGPSNPDINLLRDIASVSAMAHAPFIGSADTTFFPNMDGDFQKLPNLKDLDSIFEGPQYARWRGFRESEDARYVGLTMPRFLLRAPYHPEDNPVKDLHYEEQLDGEHDNYLWGNSAVLFASRLMESFATYRWCANIVGPEGGGAVVDLPTHSYEAMGQIESKIPTEALLTDRREFELSEQGFIPLVIRKGSDNAAFFSANSVQRPKRFPNTAEGRVAQANFKLGTKFPYMFLINRLAHYVKVMQREKIGAGVSREELQRQLRDWIAQYVSDQENPPAGIMARYPLRQADITVEDIDGDPGWYKVSINVSPHFKYEGGDFELSLVAREKAGSD
ncbi:MAG: type VI secretion system contractile sheath large subunit [Pseudomonadota bacterium]